MTVSNTAVINRYTGNDVTTVFPYVYKITAASQIEVTIADDAENETVLVLDTDYTVQDVGEEAGGTITYPISGDPLPTDYLIAVALNMPFTQEVDLLNQGPYFAETHEDEFDELTKMCQELLATLDRCIKVQITSDEDADDLLQSIYDARNDAETAQAAAELAETGAETAETGAEAAEAAAVVAQLAAEAAAASLNLPDIDPGDAGKRLEVNVGEDGYDLTDTVQDHAGVDHTDITATGAQIDAAVAAAHAQAHNAISHSDIGSTGAAIDAAVTASHAKQHDIASAADHNNVVTSVGTPGVDTNVPTEKAVRDAVDAVAVPALGTWDATKSIDSEYAAATDGFVMAFGIGSGATFQLDIRTDGASPPATIRVENGTGSSGATVGVTCPVKSGDNWKVVSVGAVASSTVMWIPLS